MQRSGNAALSVADCKRIDVASNGLPPTSNCPGTIELGGGGGREVNPFRVSESGSSWLCSSTGASLGRLTIMPSSKLGTSECFERHTLLGVFNNKLYMLVVSHSTLGSAVFRVGPSQHSDCNVEIGWLSFI